MAKDFSRDLLHRAEARLRVLRVPACGWADLGTPERLAAWNDGQAARHERRALTPLAARGMEAIPAF